MQRVVRSTLVGLLAVAGLTACGDKVTTTQVTITTTTTTPPPGTVHSVTVAPASVTIPVSGTAQLAASVDADASVTDRTVKWTSSDPTIATVSSSGLVTGVKAGTVEIIASATAAPTVQGAAAVTVGGGSSVVPTVTISGLNTTICPAGAACSSVPANLQNFGTASNAPAGQTGQLDVILNVDSQGTPLKSVSATLKCGADSLTQTQTISGAAAPIGGNASASPVTFSFNTTQFDSTGKAAVHNGSCTISASAATSAGTQSATTSQTLTLNNADAIMGTLTASKGPANDKGGLSWFGGDVTVKVTPVFYTAGRSAVSATVGLTGRDTANAAAFATATQSLSSFPGSVTFSASKTPAKGGVQGVTVNPLTATVSIVDNTGNTFAIAGNVFSNAATLSNVTRLDNQAPKPGTYTLNGKQGNANNWIGAAYTFSSTSGNGYTSNGDNNGVDNVTVTFQSAPAGSTTWTTITKATDLAASNVNTAYSLRFIETDALGNADTVTNALDAATFGVDLTAPTISLKTGTTLAQKTVCNTAAGCSGNVQANVTDDFSGPNTTFMAITRQNTGVTTNATECVLGTAKSSSTAFGSIATYNPDGSISGACVPVAVGIGTQAQVLAQGKGDGYYVASIYSSDQAGNITADSIFTAGEDVTAPTQGGVAIPASFTGGGTATFPTSATDNMDLVRSDAILQYPAANLYYSNALPGVAFDNVLTNSASYSFSIPNFISSLQSTNAGGNPVAPAAGNDRPTELSVTSVDEANNTSLATNAAFGAATFSTATAYSSNTNFTTWTAATSQATLSDCPSAGCASADKSPANKTAATLTAVATGPTGVFNIPFASVTFYYQVGGSAWYPIGTVSAPAASDNGVNRTWTYTLSFTPPKSTPQGASLTGGAAINVVAVGQDAAGNALMSQPVAITLTNP